jgi:hypothetical protein
MKERKKERKKEKKKERRKYDIHSTSDITKCGEIDKNGTTRQTIAKSVKHCHHIAQF